MASAKGMEKTKMKPGNEGHDDKFSKKNNIKPINANQKSTPAKEHKEPKVSDKAGIQSNIPEKMPIKRHGQY